MKTRIATATLTVMFLSAGAFAGGHHGHGLRHPMAAPIVDSANVTVISKNMAWPLPGHITVEACKLQRCIDI